MAIPATIQEMIKTFHIFRGCIGAIFAYVAEHCCQHLATSVGGAGSAGGPRLPGGASTPVFIEKSEGALSRPRPPRTPPLESVPAVR
jgi:hypothetical protein